MGMLRISPTADTASPVGQVLLTKYKVSRLLDEGGMSKIYLAQHGSPPQDVVVKVLKDDLAKMPKAVEHFKREIHIMARFQHPHAVAYVDSSTREASGPVLVMEYVRGIDLGQLLHRQGRFHPERAGRLLAQLCEVLQAAHTAGIVHRDLKPGNLMILYPGTPQETLKLMDFGLARMASMLYIAADEIVDWTLPNAAGTPEYICPEQVRGVDMDGRGDLYSVGVILFEMLTGRRPFQQANVDDLLQAHLDSPPPPFISVSGAGRVPEAVERVVRACLAKTPEQRPQSAAELIQRYEQAVGKSLRIDARPAAALRAVSSAVPSTARTNAAPVTERNAFTHTVETTMVEAMAMIKIKGFVHDLGSDVLDSVPGQIHVRIPGPKSAAKPQSGGLFGRKETSRQNVTLAAGAGIDLQLHMERRDPGQPNRLTITLIMRPNGGMMTVEWKNRCQQIGRDLGAYLMGR